MLNQSQHLTSKLLANCLLYVTVSYVLHKNEQIRKIEESVMRTD